MTPLMHAELINGPFGDPGVYIDFLHDRRAMLLDLGELSAMPASKINRVTHAFVSHAHLDHFIGFDRLLRILLSQRKTIQLMGPAGTIEKVEHKLAAYTWNLAGDGSAGPCIEVSEPAESNMMTRARFRFNTRFRRENIRSHTCADRVVLDEANHQVRYAQLDHKIPCLAYAVEEKQHINIWRNKVTEMGLGIGPWLAELKRAVARGDPDDTELIAKWQEKGQTKEVRVHLSDVRDRILHTTKGQKIAYVTDTGYTPENVEKIIDLADGADLLIIESPFLERDAAIAADRMHLTARQSGEIARLANAREFLLFHISSRYEQSMRAHETEAKEAFLKTERD